ncbi:hypothetical protein B0H16DRAFT_1896514 [Mycena metata]|uniref:Uncharacterized protein n=1 Tax=Mycena metata TaxID=1033252 RepID=A0AAD7HJH6_9AGAR|nr:hypothetical protein B0H16DRAFT_1896514 [Mycena metata]
MVFRFLQGLLGSVYTVLWLLRRLVTRSPSSSPHVPLTLLTLPTDVLQLVLEMLYDPWVRDEERGRYDHETCKGRYLIPLSHCCQYLRGQTLPWIFREVYNWDRSDNSIWPEALWPCFRVVHLRDRSMRHAGNIALSPAIYDTLPMMSSLTKVTLRLNSPVPVELLHALSLAPRLTLLEIYQARFDGTRDYSSLSFTRLESLVICITGFQGVLRGDNIDLASEISNVLAFLETLSRCLTALRISGDLLSPAFPSLPWPKLRMFTITEHTPTPYIAVPDLVSGMPALRELVILYTAELSRDRDAGDLYPPFVLGTADQTVLESRSPLLTSVTLSNMEPADPIFAQLPRLLPSLHLLAMVDGYRPGKGRPPRLWPAPLTHNTVLISLEHISHLTELTDLSLTLDDFVTAPVIHRIATVFPKLRFLELGHARYKFSAQMCPDVRDPTILDALQQFSLLTRLRISLNFMDREFDPDTPQRRAAHWVLQGLPNLCTVAFSWEQKFYTYGFDMVVWREWDRSVLVRPPSPPSWPPSPVPTMVEGVPMPPLELDGHGNHGVS